MAETIFSERVRERIRACQWVIQDLRAWERKVGETANDGDARRLVSRKTLVRRCEWPERADAEEAVAFLSSAACLEYLRLCREELGGTDWEPRFAWFEQADANNTRARTGYLYHALRLRNAENEDGDGPYILEDGCKRKVSATFYWGVPEVPECPESTSGVNYELTVRSWSDETGEYDCVIIKTETVEQDVAPYEAHLEQGETRVVAQMLGVREEEGSTVEAKVAAFAAEQGLELADGPQTHNGATIGVVVDVQKQKNADCTTDITLSNTHEEAVDEASKTEQRTLLETLTRTTDRNQATPEEATDPTVGTIKTVTNERTPGGLYNVTTEERTSKAIGGNSADGVCAKTIFEHIESKTDRNQRVRGEEAYDASGGTTYRVENRLNDDGTFDITRTNTHEEAVADAEASLEEGAIIRTEEKRGRNLDAQTAGGDGWATPSPPNAVAQGTLVVRRESKTPGGVKDVTLQTRKAYKHQNTFALAQNPDGSARTHVIFYNLKEAEAQTLLGSLHSASISKNAFGLFDGSGSVITREANGRNISNGRTYDEFDVYNTAIDGGLFAIGDRVYKRTITIQYRKGIVHCNNPAVSESNSPYVRVQGCAEQRVENLGNSYWSYFGINYRSVEWEYVGDVPTSGSPSIDAEWGSRH